MPHVNIKYFPVKIDEKQRLELVSSLTDIISKTFGVGEDVISIALEPVEKEMWNEHVYVPEIKNRSRLLCKKPNY